MLTSAELSGSGVGVVRSRYMTGFLNPACRRAAAIKG